MNNVRNNLLGNRRIGRIMILVLVAFFFIIAVLSFLFYKYSLNNFIQSELMKLRGVSNSIALQINGDQHEELMLKYPFKDGISKNETDSIYLQMHQLLKSNYGANMLKSPVYTLVRSLKKNYYEFGVTSYDTPYFRHKYTTFPTSLFDKYNTGGTIEPYKDEFGTWLSAFSPIKNSKGENIAIVMVDEKLENFLKASRIQLVKALAIAVTLFSVMYFFLLFILRGILRRENDDKILLQESFKVNEGMKIELQNANSQLEHINEVRKEMIANISHDLRTPLSTIIGYLELFKNEDKIYDDNHSSYLSIAYNEALRLNAMVSDLFELSKLESGHTKLDMEVFNIAELVHDVALKYDLKLKARHINLLYNIDNNGQLVLGDIKYIERVFQNLLDNAIKFVYEGGFIKISVLDEAGLIKVKVCNNGDPISDKEQENIFDRYYKNPSEKGGAGLGLAIAKKILDLHGQKIEVQVDGNINSFWFNIKKYLP